MGPLSLFIYFGVLTAGTYLKIIPKAHPSRHCDIGCFPIFVLVIFFGALAYHLRKRQKISPKTGWRKALFILAEILAILCFILAMLVIPGLEDLTLLIVSAFVSLWTIIAYVSLFFAQVSTVPMPLNKKYLTSVIIAVIVLLVTIVLGTIQTNNQINDQWERRQNYYQATQQ